MSRAANAIVVGILAVLLAFGLLLEMLPSGLDRAPASVRSSEPNGRHVVFEVLRELGIRAKAWTDSPGGLPATGDLLFLPVAPEAPPGYGDLAEDERAPIRSPNNRRLRDPRHYVRFVESGGTLLLPASSDALEFLIDTCELADFEDVSLRALLTWDTGDEVIAAASLEDLVDRISEEAGVTWGDDDPPDSDESVDAVMEAIGTWVVFPTGERFKVDWRPARRFGAPGIESPFEVELTDEQGRALALSYPHGNGHIVVLVPELEFLDNAHIDEPGNALLAVRLIERFAANGAVYFDEYVLGGWVPDSAIELAFAPQNFPFSAHLIVLVVLLLWSSAWARQFPRDPIQWSPVSAMMRAKGFASMIVRARRWDTLANMLRGGVLRRLAHRQGIRLATTPFASTEAEARERTVALDTDAVHEVVASLFGVTDEKGARRAERLFTRAIESEDDLERLGHELNRLEERALVHTHEETEI